MAQNFPEDAAMRAAQVTEPRQIRYRAPAIDATKEADRAKALQIVSDAQKVRMRAVILMRRTEDELTKDFLMHALGADQ